MGEWWRPVAGVLLTALAAASFAITGYLARLETGIEQNLLAARALVEAQGAIRDRNAALGAMAQVTRRIGAGLDGILASSEAIAGSVKTASAANRSILMLNGRVEEQNASANGQLERVATAMKSMERSASSIRDYLTALRDTARQDLLTLRAIGSNSARMNARTPGW